MIIYDYIMPLRRTGSKICLKANFFFMSLDINELYTNAILFLDYSELRSWGKVFHIFSQKHYIWCEKVLDLRYIWGL